MTEPAMAAEASSKAPWHLWVVGVLALLWNGAGTYTIMMAQAGRLPAIEPDEAAYYAAQPTWFMAVTDIALLSAALMLRSRWAVELYWLSIAAIVVTAVYDIAMETARILSDQGALIATICIWILAVLQLLYARAMKKRGVLR